MDVAILGASGDCGREIAGQLIASRLLAATERVQLVGRSEGTSARVLHGLVSDLTDAHAEHVPDLNVALSPREIVADLWIVAAGRTPPTDRGTVDRQALAANNARIFSGYAEELARSGQGSEIVLIVSNPVELGVAIFARAIGRHRVIGIGAYQDTLRFRREIAYDLGVRRQRVTGFMLGEHGDEQVPIWSSVQIHGMDDQERAQAIAALRKGTEDADFTRLCREQREALAGLVAEGRFAEAFQKADAQPPDVRVVLKPYLTHLSGAKTVLATANVTVDLVGTLLDGREVLVAGQVVLDEEDFHGLTGPFGVPVIVGPNGVMSVVEIPLTNRELSQVIRLSENVNARLAPFLSGSSGAAKGGTTA